MRASLGLVDCDCTACQTKHGVSVKSNRDVLPQLLRLGHLFVHAVTRSKQCCFCVLQVVFTNAVG
jgi:hypothetical protein